jgi:hypothetical protein
MRSITPTVGGERDPDSSDRDRGPFVQTLRFAYRHSVPLAAISVVWTLLALPLITIGPATLGAYRAIVTLRETGEYSVVASVSAVREDFLAAVLLGSAPMLFGGIGVLYLVSPPAVLGSIALGLGLGASYLGLFFAVLLIPTYYGIALGADPSDALRTGYLCVARAPRITLRIVIVTCVIFAASALLTVAIVLVFPAFTVAYHIHVIDPLLERDGDSVTPA